MIRELANFSPPDYAAVSRWPMREALIAYHVKVRASALHDFERELYIYALIAPHNAKKTNPPKVPPILRASSDDEG